MSDVSSRDRIIAQFRALDRNGDGSIDRDELAKVLQSIDGTAWPESRLDLLLSEADTNLDGRIQYNEFIMWIFDSGLEASDFCRATEGLALDNIKRVRLCDALRELEVASLQEQDCALNLLIPMFQKILKDPEDEQCRRMKRTNAQLEVKVLSLRGGHELLGAAGYEVQGEEYVLPEGADIKWVVEELSDFMALRDEDEPDGQPEAEREVTAEPAREPEPPPKWEVFGTASKEIEALVHVLTGLPPMDKDTMKGSCTLQTLSMEDFMETQVGMQQIKDEYFVQGVKAFKLLAPLAEAPKGSELVYQGISSGPGTFRMSIEEVLEWQSSFCCYYAADVYEGEDGKELLKRSLAGESKAGKEGWMMKFAIRCSRNPILMRFDGKVLERQVGKAASANVYLISVCGIDFAARVHDFMDILNYIKNWTDVFARGDDGSPKIRGGRDFVPTGVKASLHVAKCLADFKKMARLRLRAQDKLGIQVVVEVGLGLGVFAGDAIGIGTTVRMLAALAIKKVLEEESFESIKLFILSLPIFKRDEGNFATFSTVFGRAEDPYSGKTPVLVMDQDMHAIAIAAAEAGFVVGELNPADSHGVFGEYWQNFGPGTEEKLALTTCGLLTQHHVVNPSVMNTESYIPMDVSEPVKAKAAAARR